MITRVCISINNCCNLNCKYCHFHEKKDSIVESEMDVFRILDNIRQHIERNAIYLQIIVWYKRITVGAGAS